MNYCTSCGNEIAEGVDFCPKCGTKVAEVAAEPAKPQQTISGEDVKEQLAATYENTREFVQNNKYLDYFVNAVKRPTSAIGEETTSHGWIQALLFSFVTTLGLYSMITGTIKIATRDFSFMSFFGIGEGIFSVIRTEIVPRLFIVSFVAFLVFVLSAFIVLKLAGTTQKSFGQILTSFGGLVSPNIVAIFITSLLALLFASETTVGLAGMVLIFSFILCIAAYNYYLHSRISDQKLDKMYVLLLSNFLLLILMLVLIFIQVQPIITMLDRLGGF